MVNFTSKVIECEVHDKEVHFVAQVDHFIENRNTVVHGRFPVASRHKVVLIDGVHRAKKVFEIDRDAICKAFWITIGQNIGQSLVAKVANALNS